MRRVESAATTTMAHKRLRMLRQSTAALSLGSGPLSRSASSANSVDASDGSTSITCCTFWTTLASSIAPTRNSALGGAALSMGKYTRGRERLSLQWSNTTRRQPASESLAPDARPQPD